MYVYEDGRVYSGNFVQDNPSDATPDRSSCTDIDMGICVSTLAFGIGIDKRRLKRELENTFLRANPELKRRYKDACVSKDDKMLTLEGLWRIFLSLDLPRGTLSLALVDRALANTKVARNALQADIHDPATLILYREFLEVLVRVGHTLYGIAEGNIVAALKTLLGKVITDGEIPDVSWDASTGMRYLFEKLSTQSTREEHAAAKDSTSTIRAILKTLLASGVVVPSEEKPEEESPEGEAALEEAAEPEGAEDGKAEAEHEKVESASEREDDACEQPVKVRDFMSLEEAMRVLGDDVDRELIYPEFAIMIESIASSLGVAAEQLIKNVK